MSENTDRAKTPTTKPKGAAAQPTGQPSQADELLATTAVEGSLAALDEARVLDPSWADTAAKDFLGHSAARVMGNAVATTDVEKLSLDRTVVTSIDSSMSDLIKDAAITDQKRSGRCWAFAGLNVLRAAAIKQLEVPDFEFSQNFIFFYSKLEKANWFLAQMIADADRRLDDREVAELLASPIGDGGWWPEFTFLVSKYGLVPKYAMPDTDSAANSAAMNKHLSELLRRATLRLRRAIEMDDDPDAVRLETMDAAFRMLATHLGVPPTEFVWQYRNKDGDFTRVGTLTPREFAEKYMPDPDVWAVVAHDPRPEISLHTLYGIDRSNRAVGARTANHVTAELEVLKDAAIAAVKAGQPVWFACDVKAQFDKDLGVWDAHLHDYEGVYGVDLAMNKAERLTTRSSAPTHAMCLTGVDLVDGEPRRWRVENSWGDTVGEKGYWTMNDSWFDEYVYQVVVPVTDLPEDVRAALDTEPTILPSWDPLA